MSVNPGVEWLYALGRVPTDADVFDLEDVISLTPAQWSEVLKEMARMKADASMRQTTGMYDLIEGMTTVAGAEGFQAIPGSIEGADDDVQEFLDASEIDESATEFNSSSESESDHARPRRSDLQRFVRGELPSFVPVRQQTKAKNEHPVSSDDQRDDEGALETALKGLVARFHNEARPELKNASDPDWTDEGAEDVASDAAVDGDDNTGRDLGDARLRVLGPSDQDDPAVEVSDARQPAPQEANFQDEGALGQIDLAEFTRARLADCVKKKAELLFLLYNREEQGREKRKRIRARVQASREVKDEKVRKRPRKRRQRQRRDRG